MDLKQVEAFALAMRMGSLTKAEAQSGISKATLSRHIQRLEQQLGVQLLVHAPRKILPTDAGRAFQAHCEALLAEVNARLEAARTEVQEMGAGGKGRLCVLSDNQFVTTFVSQVLRLYLERFPHIECELHIGGRADSPRPDEVDCYVCAEPPDLPNLVGKLVGRLSYGLYASPAYIRRAGLPHSPQQLAEHVSIRLREPDAGGAPVLHWLDHSHPYTAAAAMKTNDYWVMKTFCLDGFGVALMPDFFARPEVQHGSLVPVLAQWKPAQRHVYCVYQKQRYMGKKLRAFIDLLAQAIDHIDSLNPYVTYVRPTTA